MTQQSFERAIDVASDVDSSWETLTDVRELVTWVSIVHSVEELKYLDSYTAVLEDRVGPFNLRADLSIDVTVEATGRTLEVVASGRDRAINSKIAVQGSLALKPIATGGCTLAVSGTYKVTGSVATMASSIIGTKADHAIDEFFDNALRVLGP